MPLRTVKRDLPEALILEWVLHAKNYRLNLDRRACVGCQICSLACPKEAIKLEKSLKTTKAQKARADIDLAKCNFCGICDILCPYGAVRVTINDEHVLSVVDKQSFPELVRDIHVDPSKLGGDSSECEEACPLGLIKITGVASRRGEPARPAKKTSLKAAIEVDKEHCPCCRVCEFKCPQGAFRVRKFINGKISIHRDKCPEGCKDCVDVCPITGALYLAQDDNKVYANELFCVFCGACKIVCPVEEALELKRTGIAHTDVKSGAWNKSLERLTSPIEVAKELKSKSSRKTVEAVEKLLAPKEE